LGTTTTNAQNGDQILDGIGETGLIARYTFKDDAKDWSRNNLHGSVQGTDFKFVKDEMFGNVLSLNGSSDTYISLPAESVTGEQTLSITGWIYLRSAKTGQLFFDFGKDSKSHFFAAPVGLNDKEEFQARILTNAKNYTATSAALPVYKWVHVAVVINVPYKTLSTFVNGALVAETKNAEVELRQLFKNNSGEANKLYIGRSLNAEYTGLNAKLHDFRIYRVALNAKQIARIYGNALSEGESTVRTNEESEGELEKFPATTPQLYNAYLKSVPDIQVETEVGNLPRLPRFVKGIYDNNIEGPEVRVIWPAPKDNSQVLTAGTYTLTGKVAGTNLQPKAIVVVKDAKAAATPNRTLEFFKLNQILTIITTTRNSSKTAIN
jgi:hypothetical protein